MKCWRCLLTMQEFANSLPCNSNSHRTLIANEVVHVLTSFGLTERKRTNAGWVLLLGRDIRGRIHTLLRRYALEMETNKSASATTRLSAMPLQLDPILILRCDLGGYHHLLVAQAIDGVEVGRQACGIIAEEQAHTNGDRKTNRYPQIRQRRGNRRHESAHQCGYSGPN